MRPKERILVVAEDGQLGAVLRFVLGAHGFAAKGCASGRETLGVVSSWQPHVVILLKFSRPASALGAEMGRLGVGVLAIGGSAGLRVNLQLPDSASMAEVIAATRVLAARQHGPRKGFHWEFVDGRRRVMVRVAKKPTAREVSCEPAATGKMEAV